MRRDPIGYPDKASEHLIVIHLIISDYFAGDSVSSGGRHRQCLANVGYALVSSDRLVAL